MLRLIPTICIILALLSPLGANQFAYITAGMAVKTTALLRFEKEILVFCQPCDDLHGRVIRVQKVEVVNVNFEGMNEVRVNGESIDLAYVFIRRNGAWKNLAVVMGLDPRAVSTELPVNIAHNDQ
jgi:hypothetical protein